ncbi:MAG TPA: hypothetical protein VF600_01100 [Abditibacteriaceae bacterium]|jgi:hypothetical protein
MFLKVILVALRLALFTVTPPFVALIVSIVLCSALYNSLRIMNTPRLLILLSVVIVVYVSFTLVKKLFDVLTEHMLENQLPQRYYEVMFKRHEIDVPFRVWYWTYIISVALLFVITIVPTLRILDFVVPLIQAAT